MTQGRISTIAAHASGQDNAGQQPLFSKVALPARVLPRCRGKETGRTRLHPDSRSYLRDSFLMMTRRVPPVFLYFVGPNLHRGCFFFPIIFYISSYEKHTRKCDGRALGEGTHQQKYASLNLWRHLRIQERGHVFGVDMTLLWTLSLFFAKYLG